MTNFKNELRLLSLNRITWNRRRNVLASERGLQLNKVINSLVINHLSCYGTVCCGPCFCVHQQGFEYGGRYKVGASKISSCTNPTCQTDSPENEINEKLVAKTHSLVDNFFYSSRIEVSNSRTINLDGMETGVLPSDFAQQLRLRKSRRFTYLLYFTGSPWYIYNSTSEPKCQSRRERKLGSFQNMIVRSGKSCTHRVVVLMGLCAT